MLLGKEQEQYLYFLTSHVKKSLILAYQQKCFSLRFVKNILCVCVFCLHLPMFVQHVHAWCSRKPESSTGFPGTGGITQGFELPFRCGESNPGRVSGDSQPASKLLSRLSNPQCQDMCARDQIYWYIVTLKTREILSLWLLSS